ncbi:MAG: hypothetical protein IT435_05830 [Phycisphaerales bacterium]|nr:hypothetical protein [Phycisphaerales bacterium]
MAETDKRLRITVGLCSALTGLMAAGTLALVFIATTKPAWFLFGFEMVEIVPIVLGILYAIRRWDDLTGLGLGCIAGTIFCGSVLGFLSIPDHRLGVQGGPVGQIDMIWWLGARILISLGIAWCAVRLALGTDRRAWWLFVRGMLLGGAALGILAVLYKFRNAPWLAQQTGMVVLLLAGVGFLVCLSVGVHYTVKAFEATSVKPNQA